jgi:hypothetical protein
VVNTHRFGHIFIEDTINHQSRSQDQPLWANVGGPRHNSVEDGPKKKVGWVKDECDEWLGYENVQ